MNDSSPDSIGATLKVRALKEIKPKASKSGAISDKNSCPVYTLWCFYNSKKESRTHLPEDHKLFVTGYQALSNTLWESVAIGTVAN